MKVDIEDIFAVFPYLAKSPSLAAACSLSALPRFLYGATKFVSAPVEACACKG